MRKLIVAGVMSCWFSACFALSAVEQQIISRVAANANQEIDFIKQAVNINSGTMNVNGVRKTGKLYQQQFEKLGFKTQWEQMPASMKRGGNLYAYHRSQDPAKSGKRILMIGHLDTVFAKDSPFQRYTSEGNIARGPGVIDMKGGNTVILYAIKALAQTNQLKNANITVALMGDEENSGQPLAIARKKLIAEAKEHDIALGYENGTDVNLVVTARRGAIFWKLTTKGKSGHSSLVMTKEFGEGAILTISRLLNQMIAVAKSFNGFTFNPGIILGGQSVNLTMEPLTGKASGVENIIADIATSSGEIRYLYQKDLDKFKQAIDASISQIAIPDKAMFELNHNMMKPPMEPTTRNKDLFTLIEKVHNDLNLGQVKAVPPQKKGAADIAFVSQIIPSIDGLGAIGDRDHSPREFMKIKETIDSTKRTALLIYRLTQ